MQRREFLITLGAGLLLAPRLGWGRPSGTRSPRYFSARKSRDGRYFISGFDAAGRHLFDAPLPGRGHDVAVHPDGSQIAAVARRPGTYLVIIDSGSGVIVQRLESATGRHFYGHGCYTADGRYFFTTESDVVTGEGKIGVRDVRQGYRQVDEYPAHGIGPHQLALLSDGRTLVVAIGGILTRPETGRSKLNLDTMSPSLVYMDADSGELLEQQALAPELHQNSIRHFAINARDEVCLAMQYQGALADQPPLVGLHRRGEAIRLLTAPESVQRRMRNYCGSVCTDVSGRWFAVSAPKGNLVTFWSASEARYVASVEVADGCGIASADDKGEFLLSSGGGGVYRYRLGTAGLQPLGRIAELPGHWDNHIGRGVS